MAYATSNPPRLLCQSVGQASGNVWWYTSTDASTVVDGSGYFTNGWELGMRAGDIVISVKSDASPISMQLHIVSSADATAVDLSNGLAVTATDSD